MKVKDLIAHLEKENQDLDVRCEGDSEFGPFSVELVMEKTAEKDEYPEDFDMPGGYKFILLKI